MNDHRFTSAWRPALGVIVIALLVFTGSSCANQWQTIKGPTQTAHSSIQMPPGWMRLDTPAYDMVTKDGPYLQYILLQEQPLDRGFQHTRRKLNRAMLAHEAAEVVVANIKSDPVIREFELISSEPADVGGREGFKLNFTYRNEYAVDMQTVYYGVVVASSFVSLRYNAAQRYYFETDLPTFQTAFESLRCLGD